jgi:hypothetical protein
MLFLLAVVLWSSLAVFGGWAGTILFLAITAAAVLLTRPACLVTLLAFLPFTALLLLVANPIHNAAYRLHCANCLQQISLALHNYVQANGCFPPAYIADKNGKPMHSWRVLILPYIAGSSFYKQYNFGEPWNGPNNKKLLPQRPFVYACPDDDKNFLALGATSTNYVAVVGASAAWSGSKPKKATDLSPMSQTITIVEVSDADIPWTAPRDVSLDAPRGAPDSIAIISSKHFSDDYYFCYPSHTVIQGAMADGSQCRLPSDLVASDEFPELLKVGGFLYKYREAEPMNGSSNESHRRINWPHCLAFTVWLASSGLLLSRAARSKRKLAANGVEKRAEEGTINREMEEKE